MRYKLINLLSIVILILQLAIFIISAYFLINYFNNLTINQEIFLSESFDLKTFNEIKNWYFP